MPNNIKKNFNGIGIVPTASLASNVMGELEVNATGGKLNYYDGSVRSPIVTEVSTANLTNKTIAGNTISAGTGTLALSTYTLTVAGTASISGTNTGDQTITLTGDVTGSGTGSFVTTLAATTNATLTTISSLVSIGTVTTGTWNATTIAINHGGTGQTTASAGFNALSPMTTGGDLIYGGASGSGTRLANGSVGQGLTSSGGTSPQVWLSTNSSFQNLGISATAAFGGILAVGLTQSDGNTSPSTGSGAVNIPFRNVTATVGGYSIVQSTSATVLNIPEFATLGQTSAVNQYVWVYAINNSGTIELAVSGVNVFPDNSIQTTTAISSSSTSGSVLYSASSRTSVQIRLIGRILINQATAGVWSSSPLDIITNPSASKVETDWSSFTASGSWNTNCTYTGLYKRVGDSMMLQYFISLSGAPNSTSLSFNMPSGFTIDRTKLSGNNVGSSFGGSGGNLLAAGNPCLIFPVYSSTSAIGVLALRTTSGTNPVEVFSSSITQSQPATFQNNDFVSLSVTVPIVGWSTFGP